MRSAKPKEAVCSGRAMINMTVAIITGRNHGTPSSSAKDDEKPMPTANTTTRAAKNQCRTSVLFTVFELGEITENK